MGESEPWSLENHPAFTRTVCRRKVVMTDLKDRQGTLCNGRIAFGLWATLMSSWHINHLEIMAILNDNHSN